MHKFSHLLTESNSWYKFVGSTFISACRDHACNVTGKNNNLNYVITSMQLYNWCSYTISLLMTTVSYSTGSSTDITYVWNGTCRPSGRSSSCFLAARDWLLLLLLNGLCSRTKPLWCWNPLCCSLLLHHGCWWLPCILCCRWFLLHRLLQLPLLYHVLARLDDGCFCLCHGFTTGEQPHLLGGRLPISLQSLIGRPLCPQLYDAGCQLRFCSWQGRKSARTLFQLLSLFNLLSITWLLGRSLQPRLVDTSSWKSVPVKQTHSNLVATGILTTSNFNSSLCNVNPFLTTQLPSVDKLSNLLH